MANIRIPARMDMQKLRAIDPSLAEQVEATWMREATKHIVQIAAEDLEPARKYILQEIGTAAKPEYNAASRAFRRVAEKYFLENNSARTALVSFISRLQGTVSEPSESNLPQTAYQCPDCSFSSRTASGLGNHRHASHDENSSLTAMNRKRREFWQQFKTPSGLYQCPECSLTMISPQGIAAHTKAVHGWKTSAEGIALYQKSKERAERRKARELAASQE